MAATNRKKIDNRIRVLIENGVALRHRSFFVIVGDKGRDQVILRNCNIHQDCRFRRLDYKGSIALATGINFSEQSTSASELNFRTFRPEGLCQLLTGSFKQLTKIFR